jgi:hypothetical protein
MHEALPGIFEGRKPTSNADFAALRQHGIRTIVSVQAMAGAVNRERRHAQQTGFCFRNVPIVASPFGPREQNVKAALEIMATPSLRPIYVHCLLGRDRTEVLLALYRVYYENWTPEAAWQHMLRGGGFKSWGLPGFKRYFWRHSKKPSWVKSMSDLQSTSSVNGPTGCGRTY